MPKRIRGTIAVVLLLVLTARADDSAPFLTQADFQQQLDRPLTVSRPHVRMREILNRLAEERSIAVWLDRRIDPDQFVEVSVNAPYFDEGIAQLAAAVPAAVTVTANTVFVTTPETARTFRTRVFLAEQQLDEFLKGDIPTQFEMSRRAPVSWEILSSPREILDQIATRYHLTIENPESIPHDLWAEGTLASANPTEALLFIASQFGMDIEWTSAKEVRFVPQFPNRLIVREHRLRGMSLEEARNRIETEFPDLQFAATGKILNVIGLLEQHERIAEILGERPPRRVAPLRPTSLDHRRFSLRMVRQPFSALIQLLRDQGIEVVYDVAALQEAGIDMETKLSLELEQATISQLLQQACEPIGLDYRVKGVRVELFPQSD